MKTMTTGGREVVVGQVWKRRTPDERRETFTVVAVDPAGKFGIKVRYEDGGFNHLGTSLEAVGEWVSDPPAAWSPRQVYKGRILGHTGDHTFVVAHEESGGSWRVNCECGIRGLLVDPVLDGPHERVPELPKPKYVAVGQRWLIDGNILTVASVHEGVVGSGCDAAALHVHFKPPGSWDTPDVMLASDDLFRYLGHAQEAAPLTKPKTVEVGQVWSNGSGPWPVAAVHMHKEGPACHTASPHAHFTPSGWQDTETMLRNDYWHCLALAPSSPAHVWRVGERRHPKPDGDVISSDLGYVEIVKVEDDELRYRYQDETNSDPSHVCSMETMERETNPIHEDGPVARRAWVEWEFLPRGQ